MFDYNCLVALYIRKRTNSKQLQNCNTAYWKDNMKSIWTDIELHLIYQDSKENSRCIKYFSLTETCIAYRSGCFGLTSQDSLAVMKCHIMHELYGYLFGIRLHMLWELRLSDSLVSCLIDVVYARHVLLCLTPAPAYDRAQLNFGLRSLTC